MNLIKYVKPTGYIKLTKTNKTNIAEIIRRQLSVQSNELIPYILNARTVLLYDPNITVEDLKASLRILIQDVEQRDIAHFRFEDVAVIKLERENNDSKRT